MIEKAPAGWQLELLGNLVMKMSNGANVKQHDESVGYPISRIETIWNGNIDSQRVKYIKENDSDFVNKYKLKEGDILFSHINSDSHIGKTAIYRGQPEVLIHGINLLLIRFSDEYCQDFFNYQFKYLKEKGAFSAVAQRAVNQSSINQHKLKSFPFIYPNLEEQKRIVVKIEELFSELDSGIASLKTAQEQLKTYRQSLLKHAFEGKLTEQWRKDNASKLETPEQLLARIQQERETRYQQQLDEWKQAVKDWEAKGKEGKKPSKPKEIEVITTTTLDTEHYLSGVPKSWLITKAKHLCDFITKGTTPSKENLISNQGEVPFIKVYNLTHKGALDFSIEPTFVSQQTHHGFLARSKVYPNDVLMNIVGPPLGKVSIVPDTYKEWNINQAIAIFRSDSVKSKFLANFLLFQQTVNFMMSQSKATAGQFNLTLEICRELPIPVPNKLEQQEIVSQLEEKLSTIEQNEKEIESALAKAELLRQSILKKAFSGQLS